MIPRLGSYRQRCNAFAGSVCLGLFARRLWQAFIHLRGRLILRDVEGGNDLLLPFSCGGELLLVLEGLAELFGEVFALAAVLLEVGFTFLKPVVEAAEGVFERCDGAKRVVADIGVVGVFALDSNVGAGFQSLKGNRKPAISPMALVV